MKHKDNEFNPVPTTEWLMELIGLVENGIISKKSSQIVYDTWREAAIARELGRSWVRAIYDIK